MLWCQTRALVQMVLTVTCVRSGQVRSGLQLVWQVLALMFSVWVLGVFLVTGLTRCAATF